MFSILTSISLFFKKHYHYHYYYIHTLTAMQKQDAHVLQSLLTRWCTGRINVLGLLLTLLSGLGTVITCSFQEAHSVKADCIDKNIKEASLFVS